MNFKIFKSPVIYSLILAFFFTSCSENSSTSIDTTSASENNSQESVIFGVDEVTINIPSLSQDMEFIFLSDLHIVVNDDYVDESERALVEDRKNSFSINSIPSADYWPLLAEEISLTPLSGILMGGDMVDFASVSTLSVLKTGIDKLDSDYMYIRADHDIEPYWCSATNKDEMLSLHREIDGMPGIGCMEYDDFVIMGWDNSTGQMSEESLNEALRIIELNKPIILLTHVPIEPLVDDSLSLASKEAWQDRALLWGDNSEYYPDENTRQFLDKIYEDNSPFVEILSGHLHFSWEGYVTESVHQHVFSPACSGNIGIVHIRGN